MPEELAIGSVLAWDAFDERGRLLLRRGYVVDRNSQIEALIERGLFVEQNAAAASPPPLGPSKPSKPEPTALSTLIEARHRLDPERAFPFAHRPVPARQHGRGGLS